MYEDEIPVGRAKDLRGQKFGRLTVLYRVKNIGKHTIWKCKCECGTLKIVRQDALISGQIKSCGCLHKENSSERMSSNLLNNRFNFLTVIEKTDKRTNNGQIIWKCQCDCGTVIEIPTSSLINGNTKSCGCLQKRKASEVGSSKVINLLGKKFGKLTVLKQVKSKNENACWECLCECGSKCIVSGCNLRSGKTMSCGCISSQGEWKIARLLNENNFHFLKEYSFEQCRFPNTNNLARFDFFINNNYLIEFDGKQHFEYTGIGWDTKENYKKTIYRDEYKTNGAVKIIFR